jgi:catecholate siderophore receptor
MTPPSPLRPLAAALRTLSPGIPEPSLTPHPGPLPQGERRNTSQAGRQRGNTSQGERGNTRILPLGALLTGMAFASLPALSQAPGRTEEVTAPAVEVQGNREEDTYRSDVTSVGKLPQAPRDVPQSLTVIPQQVFEDRGAASLAQALQNAPGITFAAGEGGRIGDNFSMRGFPIYGDLYLDGLRDVAQYNRDVFNLQQIDVLRGASSMLFGRGSTGGVVNQVSKQPTLVDRYQAAFTLGSNVYKRATVDLNKALGPTTAVRLNAMVHDADSFRGEGPHYERYGVAPSITWGIGTRLEVNLSYFYLNEDNVPDFGVPYFQNKPLDVPVDRFYGFANGAYERYETSVATASVLYRFTPDMSIRSVLRKGDYERDLWASVPRLPAGTAAITDSTPVNRQRQARGGEEDPIVSQTDFTSAFKTGRMSHLLLAGVELAHEEADRWSYAPTGTIPPTTVGNPDPYPVLPVGFFNQVRTGQVSFESDSIGLYVQDIVEFLPRWKLLLGVRWDQLDADYERAAPLGPLSRKDQVWSYRTGLIWQPTPMQSYYLAYGTSFNPSAELYSLDVRGSNTPPEESRNTELGAKWDFERGLSLRAALFRTEKTNERNTDPLVADEFLLSGRRHTDGIELEAAGRITPRWEVFGGVAWMDAEIDESINPNEVGNWPLYTPPYTANLWTVYRLGGGWQVGGGFNAAGKRYGNNANTNYAPSYVRWDAMLSYEQRYWALRFNVFNLFDTVYYETVYQGHVIPGTSRVVLGTLELRY